MGVECKSNFDVPINDLERGFSCVDCSLRGCVCVMCMIDVMDLFYVSSASPIHLAFVQLWRVHIAEGINFPKYMKALGRRGGRRGWFSNSFAVGLAGEGYVFIFFEGRSFFSATLSSNRILKD